MFLSFITDMYLSMDRNNTIKESMLNGSHNPSFVVLWDWFKTHEDDTLEITSDCVVGNCIHISEKRQEIMIKIMHQSFVSPWVTPLGRVGILHQTSLWPTGWQMTGAQRMMPVKITCCVKLVKRLWLGQKLQVLSLKIHLWSLNLLLLSKHVIIWNGNSYEVRLWSNFFSYRFGWQTDACLAQPGIHQECMKWSEWQTPGWASYVSFSSYSVYSKTYPKSKKFGVWTHNSSKAAP